MEFILEVVLEPICDLVFSSRRVRTGVKTTAFLIFTQIITVLLAYPAVLGDNITETGRYIMSVCAALWCIATVLTAIYGHKHKWKHW